MKKIIAIFILLIIAIPVFSNIVEDKGNNKSRFSDEKLDDMRNDGDFYYIEAKENQTDFYDTFGEIVKKGLELIFGNKLAVFILRNISYIILAIVLVILFFYFRKIKIRGISYRDRRKISNEIDIQEANIVETNFDDLIKEAFNKEDFSLAIRYHYLKMLQQLNSAELIVWEPHKTNFDYFIEIKPEGVKTAYRKLSILFEYIWYGEGNISKDDYFEVEKEFISLKV